VLVFRSADALQNSPLLASVLLLGPIASGVINLTLPFQRNDGYFLLCDLSGIDNLGHAAAQAAASLLSGHEPNREGDVWWMPWYGVGDMLASGLTYGALSGLLSAPVLPLPYAFLLGCMAGLTGRVYALRKSLADTNG
jgi:hypothetical protein